MSEKITPQIQTAIKEIESILVNKQYEFLDTQIPSRLPAERIKRVIEAVHSSLSQTPDEAYKHLEMVRISGSNPPQWFVDFDLWINGAKSDLTLSLLIISKEDGTVIATLNDIHTL